MPQTRAHVPLPAPGRTGPRVVVVEDEEDFRVVLEGWLSPRYEIILLPHGEDLLNDIIQLSPDALILDIGLPGVDGVSLCARLRAHPRTAGVPILMVSGMGDESTRARARDAGASGFLSKPLQEPELRAGLQSLIEKNSGL